MTVEQIAIRQEIRQLLNEAGINKNTIKETVKEVINEELVKAVKQVMHEMDYADKIHKATQGNLAEMIKQELRASIDRRVNGMFYRMNISVNIQDNTGTNILEEKQ